MYDVVDISFRLSFRQLPCFIHFYGDVKKKFVEILTKNLSVETMPRDIKNKEEIKLWKGESGIAKWANKELQKWKRDHESEQSEMHNSAATTWEI